MFWGIIKQRNSEFSRKKKLFKATIKTWKEEWWIIIFIVLITRQWIWVYYCLITTNNEQYYSKWYLCGNKKFRLSPSLISIEIRFSIERKASISITPVYVHFFWKCKMYPLDKLLYNVIISIKLVEDSNRGKIFDRSEGMDVWNITFLLCHNLFSQKTLKDANRSHIIVN